MLELWFYNHFWEFLLMLIAFGVIMYGLSRKEVTDIWVKIMTFAVVSLICIALLWIYPLVKLVIYTLDPGAKEILHLATRGMLTIMTLIGAVAGLFWFSSLDVQLRFLEIAGSQGRQGVFLGIYSGLLVIFAMLAMASY